MQRFLPRKLFSAALRCGVIADVRLLSSQAEAVVARNGENECADRHPKMPSFDYTPPPYDGPRSSEIIRKRAERLTPSLSNFLFYKNPLNIVDGKRQYLFDEDGRRYLDAYGGIAVVCCGHCHPDVVEAIVNQANRIQHLPVAYLNHAISDFAEALTAKFPGNLKTVFFTNSGTEANELALMLARLYTGTQDVISVRNGYHGNAAGTMGTTGQRLWKFNIVQTGVHHAQNPDSYRGIFGSDGEKYAKDVQEIIDYGTSGRVAAFISEAIQGVGGVIELAPGYLPAVYKSVRKAGGLCIADEVQCGFARTGSHFWGFEAHGVTPDIVTLAKGIGNGIPLGAVVTTPEIAQVLSRSNYFNTFGGNPLCTATAHSVLKVIEKEKLKENAHVVGSYLKDQLRTLQEKHNIVGDVRGRGLMLGMEFVSDRELKTPNIQQERVGEMSAAAAFSCAMIHPSKGRAFVLRKSQITLFHPIASHVSRRVSSVASPSNKLGFGRRSEFFLLFLFLFLFLFFSLLPQSIYGVEKDLEGTQGPSEGSSHILQCRPCCGGYVPLASDNYGSSRQSLRWGSVSSHHTFPS